MLARANWLHAGLIHLLLSNARIVDIRREQQDIARPHHAYAGLMAHFDAMLPGRVAHNQARWTTLRRGMPTGSIATRVVQ